MKEQDVFLKAKKHYISAKACIIEHLGNFESRDIFRTSFGLETLRLAKNMKTLSKIKLATFDDELSKWKDFRDLFRSLIYDVKRIPSVKKMQYLKGCLIDETTEIIREIKLTAEDYHVAWNQLLIRYDNP